MSLQSLPSSVSQIDSKNESQSHVAIMYSRVDAMSSKTVPMISRTFHKGEFIDAIIDEIENQEDKSVIKVLDKIIWLSYLEKSAAEHHCKQATRKQINDGSCTYVKFLHDFRTVIRGIKPDNILEEDFRFFWSVCEQLVRIGLHKSVLTLFEENSSSI